MDNRSNMVSTPLCSVTAFLPSGETAMPKGSCVMRMPEPAGSSRLA
ncbi:MAG: hypothetical protein IPI77_17385 [Saprospiraceae bacterium]|nr:hypothetical protein [Saprospiraceae bacterium]